VLRLPQCRTAPDHMHQINHRHVLFTDCSATVCTVVQSGEHFGNSSQFLIVRRHKESAAVRTRLLRLRLNKAVVMLICAGTVGGLYYTSLDRQNRRKVRATADGVVRFLRYQYSDSC